MEMTVERRTSQKRLVPGVISFFERGWFAPFLLSIQPILQLFSINVAELSFSEILRSLFVSFFFGVVLLGIIYLFLRDWRRASLVVSLFLFLFFLFGDIAVWLAKTFSWGPARTDFVMLVLVTIIMLVWIWFVRNRIREVASINLYFNLLAVLLFITAGIRMSNYLLENGFSFPSKQ